MRKMMEGLLALQTLQFDSRSRKVAAQTEIEVLRRKMPTSILADYERLVLRGKKGVAIARAGVCSECHLRIPVGKLASLRDTDRLHRCDNCGRYLYLPDGESIGLSEPKPASASTRRRRAQKAAIQAD
ncbi:MAG TPA: C4-type zinc ribbon domain-containing protein [Verrucomicrobiota bacterium]|nr:C4-type zinc ribbon domain-containing protein [Verrucomicrobiota bacterium]